MRVHRQSLLIAALTCCAACLQVWILNGHAFTPGSPKLETSPLELDFGALIPGASSTRSVTLKNVGHGALVIQKVQASCACTAIKLNRQTLQPGAVAELEVTMKGKAGGATAELRISSNDPARPLATIDVSSSDGRSVVAEPAFVDFRGSGGGLDVAPVVVRLSYRDAQEQMRQGMPRVYTSSNVFEVQQPVALDKQSLVFSVSMNEPLLRGMLRGTLLVRHSTGEDVQIPVTVYAPSEFYLPLSPILVNRKKGVEEFVLELQSRAGAARPARLSVRTETGQWVVDSQVPLDCVSGQQINLALSLSLRAAESQAPPSALHTTSPAEHLIVDVFDGDERRMESICIPINDVHEI